MRWLSLAAFSRNRSAVPCGLYSEESPLSLYPLSTATGGGGGGNSGGGAGGEDTFFWGTCTSCFGGGAHPAGELTAAAPAEDVGRARWGGLGDLACRET